MSKAEDCLDELGMTLDEFLESPEAQDSVMIGICKNPNCSYTTEVEPDCRTGYCEECQTQTVRSLLVLLGLI